MISKLNLNRKCCKLIFRITIEKNLSELACKMAESESQRKIQKVPMTLPYWDFN